MNLELVDKITKAVLYEGYLLYPYRASAVKNRQRWNFGAVYPEAFSAASGGTDACLMQTQCLVIGSERTALDIKARFLHLLAREAFELIEDRGLRDEDRGSRIDDRGSRIEDRGSRIDDRGSKVEDILNPPSSILDPPSSILNPPSSIFAPPSSDPRFRMVESLEANGERVQTWQEAVEREASTRPLKIGELCANSESTTFSFPAHNESRSLHNSDGTLAGMLNRRQQSIRGEIEVSAERLNDHVFKITVRILNRTAMSFDDINSRDEALMRALVSTHTVLGVREGEFASLLDVPDDLRDWAAACINVGAYPVLVGEPGDHDLMLSSPIILYDYPQIAPESAGDLFDSTEIDEILTLRILTLTDEEKREMREVDDRARQILERTEMMPLEQLMKMHGAVRGLRPVSRSEES